MCVWARLCVSQIGLIFCWLSAEMPDNIDLAAEVSGRPVWLLSNQSDYTHKLASTHTYKKSSIRATDSVIDFPVYLCVGQCQLKAHILYCNGYVSLYVSVKYCFVSCWKFQMKFVSFAFNPFCSCQCLHVTLVLENLACVCLFLTDSIRQLSRCSICQSVPKNLECTALVSSSPLLFIQTVLARIWVCVITIMDFKPINISLH